MSKLSRTKGGKKLKSNRYEEYPKEYVLFLNKGLTTKISKPDFQDVMKFHWYATKVGKTWDRYYVRTTVDSKKIYLHRFLLPEAKLVDHINGDRSDNRRSNLREATAKENSWNRHKINSVSGAMGVSWHQDGFWYGRVYFLGKCHHVGSFGLNKKACSLAVEEKRHQLLGEYYEQKKQG